MDICFICDHQFQASRLISGPRKKINVNFFITSAASICNGVDGCTKWILNPSSTASTPQHLVAMWMTTVPLWDISTSSTAQNRNTKEKNWKMMEGRKRRRKNSLKNNYREVCPRNHLCDIVFLASPPPPPKKKQLQITNRSFRVRMLRYWRALE